ncbi:MAG: hypothetical protein JW925_09340 [Syntrophaceae bacterium]|nr:hypothetical protein [Syntrophaceae bacterium]
MDRKKLIWIISILLVIGLFGYWGINANNKLKHKIVIAAINALFEIEMPSEVDKLTVFLDGWQGHGFHIYFEIPSEHLKQIKTERYEWKEIPEEYRNVVLSTIPENSNKIQGEQWNYLHERSNSLFNYTKTILKIHNNNSDRIQWYFYSDESKGGTPEKR